MSNFLLIEIMLIDEKYLLNLIIGQLASLFFELLCTHCVVNNVKYSKEMVVFYYFQLGCLNCISFVCWPMLLFAQQRCM